VSQALPDGYERHEAPDLTFVHRSGDHETIQAMGLTDLVTLEDRLRLGAPGGRGRVVSLSPPDGLPGPSLILKQVLHGGLYGRLNRDRFRGPGRLFRELEVTVQARERGVPLPELGFLAWTRDRPCRLYLASVRVPASRSLADWICRDGRDPGRRPALRAAARAVREMHDAGMWHGDLNLRNLLVAETDGPPEGFVIDVFGSRLHPRLDERRRAENLARLLRSVLKDDAVAVHATARDRARFLRDYGGGDERFRERCGRVRRELAWLPFHRVGWRLGLR
jgi:tRNA A-37 threonylcarbamoyl transferase component Bud32